ncbi:hypothetical protein, partial [Cellvibrio sp.]
FFTNIFWFFPYYKVFFFFSCVSKVITDCLSEYNLYINEGKLKKYKRPFNTEKSNIIGQIKLKIQQFEDKFLEDWLVGDKHYVTPKKINNRDSLAKYFIEQIKHVCTSEIGGYEDVSSYLISTLSNRVVSVVYGFGKLDHVDDEEKFRYKDVIMLLCRLLFFFYSVNPQVSSSYKLAKTVIIIDKFFLYRCPEFSGHFRTQIMSEVNDIKFTSDIDGGRSKFVSLEGLNILLATSEFGVNYLIAKDRLMPFFKTNGDISYFSLVSILYYIRDHSIYLDIKKIIEDRIINKLDNCSAIARDSEIAHIFFDSLSCPYLSYAARKKILSVYLSQVDPDLTLNAVELDAALCRLQSVYWFVKWRDLDLIKLLERKELNSAY